MAADEGRNPDTGTTATEAAAIREAMQSLSRQPFRHELAKWLGCAPTDAALKAFASKSPDRWAQGVAVLTRAAGYTDRQEIDLTGLLGFAAKLESLSDAETEAMLREHRASKEPPRVSEITPKALPSAPTAPGGEADAA